LPTIQEEKVGRWQWNEVCCKSLDELEELRKQELKDCVLRLTFAMEVNLRERERVDAIIQELKGTEAAHGKAGALCHDVSGLELVASRADFDAYVLPDVLQSVIARLEAQAVEREGDLARRALYHLYTTLRTSGAARQGARTAQRRANP
jgi:hypothetical protein